MRRWPVLGLVLLAGCVYYNGMYNANRLAHAAEKAEREGRPFDAQSNWAQAEVRADTVLARHGSSEWADDALLIKGKARLKQDDCPGAVAPLQTVILNSPDPELQAEASLALAECQLQLGEPGSALSLLVPVLRGENQERRVRALRLRVRALNRLGRYQEAVAALEEIPQPPNSERLVALSGARHVPEALTLAESLRAAPRPDTSIAWDSVLAVLGRVDPAAGTRLTEILMAPDTVSPTRRARLLVEDAQRWLGHDTAAAQARLARAAEIKPANQYSNAARLTQAKIALARVDGTADLDTVATLLQPLLTTAGFEGLAAKGLAQAITRVRATLDSVGPGTPAGDLETFLTAELARDSLRAPALAKRLFHRVGEVWPASPYAPKALLALALADPTHAEAYYSEAGERYPESPYLLYLSGTSTPDLLALEDSLRLYAFTRLGAPTPNRATPARRRRDQANEQPADELP